jgi:hypothetical protein
MAWKEEGEKIMSNQSELLEAVMIAIPYPSQVTDIDLAEEDAITFTWRGNRFHVNERTVEQIEGRIRSGSNLAILMECVIKRGLIAAMDRKERQQNGAKNESKTSNRV